MDGRRVLAEAFDAWIERSGMNQAQIAAAGGPSSTSQTKVRQTDEPLSRHTLQKIDVVTGWPAGTAGRIMRGQLAGPPENVGPSHDDEDSLLFRRPDTLTAEQWRKLKERKRGDWEWEVLRAAQER